MNSNIIPLRRDVLPANIFQAIDDYMHGRLTCIHIIGITHDGQIINTSAGDVPDVMRQNDSFKKRG